ncbi:MAG: PAS domain S-box protein [Actinomycetota bacterium]|nr:PAS domain S-box protein [Actinomycetota bacterium]
MPPLVDASLFDRVSDGIFVVDREWVFVFVNEAGARMLGGAAAELLGRRVWDIVPDLVGSVFDRNFRYALERQEVVEFDDFIARFGRFYTVRVFPSSDGLTVNLQDSSAHHAADRALDVLLVQSRRQQRLAKVLAEANEAVFRSTTTSELFAAAVRIAVEDGGFVMSWIGLIDAGSGVITPIASSGAAAAQYLEDLRVTARPEPAGMGPAGMAARSGVVVCSNDIRLDDNMMPWREAAGRAGYRSSGAFPMVVSGEVAAILSVYAAEPGYFDTEEISLVRRLAANVSFGWESLMRESALRESEVARRSGQRFRAMLAAAPDAIIGIDADRHVELVNSQAERLFAARADDLVGVPVADLLPGLVPHAPGGGEPAGGESSDAQLIEGRELEARRRDGSSFPAEAALSRVEEAPGQALLLASVRDLTERFELEAERRQRALETQREQADRLDSLGMLAGGIAHDFNNLLGVVLNYTTLLEREVSDRRALADLSEIRAAATRAAELTRQLLTFARRDPANPVVLEVNDAVRSVASMFSRTLGPSVELALELDPHPLTALLDRQQFDQVLVNLMINARDAMAGGGRLVITSALEREPAAGDAEWVVLSVTDTGAGMSEEVKARAFEPFFTTKPRGEGTGLGLAAVYGIVNRSGGTVLLTSSSGAGTTVTVRLPLTRAVGAPARTVEARAGRGRPGESVLVVEDDATLREATARIIAAAGFDVALAADGEEALALVERREDIGIVLTDVIMPKMRGDELAAALRARRPGVKVVMMTGHDADKVASTERLLFKPVPEHELLGALREELDA